MPVIIHIHMFLQDYQNILLLGHDRRYDNLGTAGAKGLLTDTRAIGADWRFVGEELFIASNQFVDPITRVQAGILGAGIRISSLPKNNLSACPTWWTRNNRYNYLVQH